MREREVVLELVRAGGELLQAEAERPDGPRGEWSTAPIDDEICALLVEGLAAAFPDDTIVSEELPTRPGTSTRTWYVDPHDGTSHFLRGSRDTSIAVGLVEGPRHLLGVVYAPCASPLTCDGLLVEWTAGGSLRRDGGEVEPRTAPGLDDPGLVVLASPAMRGKRAAWTDELLAPGRWAPCGSVATRAALVSLGEASGWVTLFNRLGPWDYAAGQALHEAGGGALVDLDGVPLRWRDGAPADPEARFFFGGATPELAEGLAARYRDALAAELER